MGKQNEVQTYLEKLSPIEMIEDKSVELQFVRNFEAIHGANGIGQYRKEQFYFMKLLNDNPILQECTRMSLYGCFMEISSNGLSLDNTSKPLAYIIPRNVKSGHKNEKGQDIYEKRAYIMVTGYGELVQRQRAGQIKYADNPVIVYEGDSFEAGVDANGRKYVSYKMAFPRRSTKIIAAFIRLERLDGSVDYQWLLEDDFLRLKKFSEKNNSKWVEENGKKKKVDGDANALYSSHNGGIDPGFLENKMIKHAFDSFPKVRTSEFTLLETNDDIQAIEKHEPEQPEIIQETKPIDNIQESTVIVEDENF